MNAYPFDLIFTVVAASVTVFLGFLPAKRLRPGFFAREAFQAACAWIGIAAISPLGVMHYPLILAVLCFIAWRDFHRDDTFTGKIWLSLASGLGISVGVLVLLAVTPGSLPTKMIFTDSAGLPAVPGWDWVQAGCLASLYLGGAVIGLAYVGCALCREAATRPGLGGLIQSGLGLLFNLTLIRGVVLLVELATVSHAPVKSGPGLPKIHLLLPPGVHAEEFRNFNLLLIGICVGLVLPTLAYRARRAAGFSSRLQPTRLLAAMMLVGFITEILARIECV